MEHKLICSTHKPILPVMPESELTLKFEAWGETVRHPIVIYADFETILEKVDEKRGANTRLVYNHKPMSNRGLLVKAANDVPSELLEEYGIPVDPIIYRGSEDETVVAKHFVETIRDISKRIKTNY